MDIILTILGFVAALVVLVAVHEFGHFYVARLCGVKVLRFCIGLGKPFVSRFDRSGTEYALAPFPLGGYVKLLDEREVEVPPHERHMSFNGKTVWQRIAILAAGPIANFILAFGLFWLVLLGRGEIGFAPIIGSIVPASMADRAGLEVGQEIVAVDGVSTESRMAVMEQLFRRLGESGRLELRIKNPDSEIHFDVDVPLRSWMAGAKDPNPVEGLGIEFYFPGIQFGPPTEGSPAAEAGLRSGDKLRALDDLTPENLSSVIEYIRARPDQQIIVEVVRDQVPMSIAVQPRAFTEENGEVVGQFGVPLSYQWPESMIRKQEFGVVEALTESVQMTVEKSHFVLLSLGKLVQREISVKNLSGPVGIAKVAGDHAKAGFIYFVEFLALLSIYLGVLNLLPIPILDGGQILYCLIEAVKGSPLSERVQMMGFSVGLTILVLVMIVALYNDILRFQ